VKDLLSNVGSGGGAPAAGAPAAAAGGAAAAAEAAPAAEEKKEEKEESDDDMVSFIDFGRRLNAYFLLLLGLRSVRLSFRRLSCCFPLCAFFLHTSLRIHTSYVLHPHDTKIKAFTLILCDVINKSIRTSCFRIVCPR